MLYAGFSRVDVTPPLGTPLDGAMEVRTSNGVLDPIELNAVAFSDGENKAVLITADFLYVMENAATEIRNLISEKCKIPATSIFMQGLHQHTSVRIGSRPHINKGFQDREYLSVLYRKYCDVVNMAMNDMKEASLFVGEKEVADTLSFIRRYRMKDGTVHTNPGRRNPNVVHPMGEADNTVRVVRLKREGDKDIAIVNFSTHPDVIGGTCFSADWPGFVRRFTEKDLPDVHCILVNGPQGDTNHVDTSMTAEVRQGYSHSQYMGRTITDAVVDLWENLMERKPGKVWCDVQMKMVPTNTVDMDRVEEYQQWNRDIKAGLREKPRRMDEVANFARVLQLPYETLFQKVPASVLAIGDVAFAGFGGEPFTQYAAAAREAGKEIYVISACLTNGGQGYLPTVEAYGEGGYESSNSRFSPEVAPILQGAVAEMLETYRKFNQN